MILQALNTLYNRLADDPAYGIAAPGYSTQKIAFAVVIHPDGRLHAIHDLRDNSGKKPQPVQLLVPGQSKPTGSGLNPCFLWDNSAYLLGHVTPRGPKESDDEYLKRKERTAKSFVALREQHLAKEGMIDDPDFNSVCRFLEQWQPDRCQEFELLNELISGFGIFQIIGETRYVHENQAIRDWWDKQQATDDRADRIRSMCLVTGEQSVPAKIHEPKIKGVGGAQSSGALLVSYNCDAFTSYGKEQSRNAPVSEAVAFRYCTALNGVLSGPRSNQHRITVGDSTVVFWTDQPTVTEALLGDLFSGGLQADATQDEAALQQTKVLLKALRNGGGELASLGDDPTTPIYLLGLAPNAARLSVRLWHADSLLGLFDSLKAHYDALHIVRQFEEGSKRPDPVFPPAWMLLRETARESKDIPPLLGGALMRAILQGTPYPDALASAVVRRIRADHTINYCRVAMLKAWLTRKPNQQGGIPVSLDTERTDPAYRLGRLFAALEKTQERAQPGINATIRERFYSAASATPSMVFPRLLRTYQHHLAKLHPGEKVKREKLVQEIVDGMDTMPPHLNLEAQANFAIGYYHQRKALFNGNGETKITSNDQEITNEVQE